MKDRTSLISECDRLWHLLVAHKFQHRCILCGQPGTDPHHWRYIRSILRYRWVLENGVYMCRVCHNETEQEFKNRRLYTVVRRDYPDLWVWGDGQPPLNSEPISTARIQSVLASLQHIAEQTGVKYERD